MVRSALIVDDSRTALAVLSRLLAAHGVRADTAESGSEALDTLRHNAAPDVIFLDHMMPGMDGFETLAALKADARTAVIPVVMYTSRDGEAYVGQALAQGAVGILHKPVAPAELDGLLARLGRGRPVARPESAPPRATTTGVIDVPPAVRAASPSPAITELPVVLAPDAPRGWWRGWLLVLVGAGLVGMAGWSYQRAQHSEQERTRLADELAQLRAAPPPVPEPAAPAAVEPARASGAPVYLDTLTWALNQNNQFGLNEEPFGDARLGLARELVARLTAAGFRGTVRFEGHLGEFCLARDEQGVPRLPAETSPFTACEVVTYAPGHAAFLSGRQSLAFTRFIAQATGPVRVVVAPQGSSRPQVAYPVSASVQTAGEWNAAARMNQRVEIVLVPAP